MARHPIRRGQGGVHRHPVQPGTCSRPRVEQIVAGLLDDLAEHGPPADIVQILTRRAPVMVICEVLGVPYGDPGRFSGFPKLVMSTGTSGNGLLEYFEDLVAERRA